MAAKKKKATPNSKAPLGEGGRFAALTQKLAGKPGVKDPAALAAAIGRKKYGKKGMAALASKGEAGAATARAGMKKRKKKG